jgi:hypothetical protein
VTVWVVELGRGADVAGVKGSLALAADALLFRPAEQDRPERRFALVEIAKVRRLRGSPVLMLVHGGPVKRRTAFYFVPPPPLERPEGTTRPMPFALGGNTKRKVRRQNVSYLGMTNAEKKELVREWERQVRTAVDAAR